MFNLWAFQHTLPFPEEPHFKFPSELSSSGSSGASWPYLLEPLWFLIPHCGFLYQNNYHIVLQQLIHFSGLSSISSSREKMVGFLCLWVSLLGNRLIWNQMKKTAIILTISSYCIKCLGRNSCFIIVLWTYINNTHL